MKNELHILTSYVELLIMSRPAYHSLNILESIKTERERLQELIWAKTRMFNMKFAVN